MTKCDIILVKRPSGKDLEKLDPNPERILNIPGDQSYIQYRFKDVLSIDPTPACHAVARKMEGNMA